MSERMTKERIAELRRYAEDSYATSQGDHPESSLEIDEALDEVERLAEENAKLRRVLDQWGHDAQCTRLFRRVKRLPEGRCDCNIAEDLDAKP